MKIVISQPMFFPWVGLFEQLKLSDVYVHYDDVQFPLGRSFTNRVQIKTKKGTQWLTIPVRRQGIQLIKDIVIDDSKNWRDTHLKTLQHNYAKAPFAGEMFEIVESVYSFKTIYLSDINIFAIEKIAKYLNIPSVFLRSSKYHLNTSSSERLLEIVENLKGSVYITGHGAYNYMNHDLFEQHGIRVEYMDYQKIPYPQLHGEFTPYVSILDLIANVGKAGRDVITSGTVYWKDFIK